MSFLLLSCKEAKQKAVVQNENSLRSANTTQQKSISKNPTNIDNRKRTVAYWYSKDNYYPNLYFGERDTLWLAFDGQCEYGFPFKIEDDSIIAYWARIEDCTHDIGITKSFGLKDKPSNGKPFLILKLINDTTLRAQYRYQHWINLFNQQYKESGFPNTFLAARN